MDLPPRDSNQKQTLDKSNEQIRGFKPLISIPIIVSNTGGNDKPIQTLRDPNLSLDVRLNAAYQEYLRLFKESRLIKATIQHVKKQKGELEWKLKSLQAMDNDQADSKKKRHRRNASEIVRSYVCPMDNCDKSYGAEASLAQHIKLKHQSYFGTPQYQKYIQQLNKRAQNDNYN